MKRFQKVIAGLTAFLMLPAMLPVSAEESALTLTNGTVLPARITMQKQFCVKGIIRSESEISSVVAGIYGIDGTLISGVSTEPKTDSFNLNQMNDTIRFENLPEGVYVYEVRASNATLTNFILTRQTFICESPETVSVPTETAPTTTTSEVVTNPPVPPQATSTETTATTSETVTNPPVPPQSTSTETTATTSETVTNPPVPPQSTSTETTATTSETVTNPPVPPQATSPQPTPTPSDPATTPPVPPQFTSTETTATTSETVTNPPVPPQSTSTETTATTSETVTNPPVPPQATSIETTVTTSETVTNPPVPPQFTSTETTTTTSETVTNPPVPPQATSIETTATTSETVTNPPVPPQATSTETTATTSETVTNPPVPPQATSTETTATTSETVTNPPVPAQITTAETTTTMETTSTTAEILTTDTVSISNGMTIPSSLDSGQAVSVRGMLLSSSVMQSVTAGVYDSDGELVTGKTVNINSTSYNLNQLDNDILFDSLQPADYSYQVIVMTNYGSQTVTKQNFTVKAPAGVTYIRGILIVNKTYSLPSTYNPNGLLPCVQSAFNQMVAAAKSDGISLWVASGFRSYTYQQNLYNRYVSQYGQAKADTFSARAGHSEHQTGMAIDVNNASDSFAGTKEAQWLAVNCWKYGFIIRYPQGKQSVTGFQYEPWHVRWLGTKWAKIIHESGLTLEEYLDIDSVYR